MDFSSLTHSTGQPPGADSGPDSAELVRARQANEAAVARFRF